MGPDDETRPSSNVFRTAFLGYGTSVDNTHPAILFGCIEARCRVLAVQVSLPLRRAERRERCSSEK
jgi:hypothetical protein